MTEKIQVAHSSAMALLGRIFLALYDVIKHPFGCFRHLAFHFYLLRNHFWHSFPKILSKIFAATMASFSATFAARLRVPQPLGKEVSQATPSSKTPKQRV
jgi:hypothetical protein